jgi:hypothetical protein
VGRLPLVAVLQWLVGAGQCLSRYLICERLFEVLGQAVQPCGWTVPVSPEPGFGAGFSLHRHLPSKLGFPVGSTGGLRLPATPGDVLHELGEVASGVQVTVNP